MAVLVTRPQPDNEATAAALRAEGFEVLLAPMLRFEPVPFFDDNDVQYAAVIVTSANALRAIDAHLKDSRLLKLPLFAVGDHTAEAAERAGFTKVIVAGGDAAAVRASVLTKVKAKVLKKTSTLLYLAGADLARDLASELGEHGFNVVTQTTYRMFPLATLPAKTTDAFTGNSVQAVLHYSRRSARAFVEAVRAAGLEITALALPQCCISDAVGTMLRDAGATRVMVASLPTENALFETLHRALRSGR